MTISSKTKKNLVTIFIIGVIIFALINIVGQYLLTRMAFNKDGTSMPENNKKLARMASLMLWGQTLWILFGLVSGIVSTIMTNCNKCIV